MDIRTTNFRGTARIALLALTIVAGTSAENASSASSASVQQRVLHYSHLDLNSMDGVRVLYGRLRDAAEAVCGDRQRVGSRITSQDWRECRDRAISDAVARLDKPALSAYHQRRIATAG
jgi:UrcA family protein